LLSIIIIIIVLAFVVLNTWKKKSENELISFKEGIRYENKESYLEFVNNNKFESVEINLFLYKDDIRVKTVELDKNYINKLWEFISNSKDPYLKRSGSFDIDIDLIFVRTNGDDFIINIFKDHDKDVTFFWFKKDGDLTPTSFSCFDKNGFISNFVERYKSQMKNYDAK
jgi:hypothetical protein